MQLLIEIEPEHVPKKVLGEVLPVLLADSYTPSHCCGLLNQFLIKDAVFLFVTVIPDNSRSQTRAQLLRLEQTIVERLDFHKLAVRTVKFCVGNSDADAVQQCKDAIQKLLC